MLSSKKSKKTLSSAESAAPVTSETAAAKPRATKSSSTLKSKAADVTSEKKPRATAIPAPVPAAATHSDTPRPVHAKPVSHDDIAKLAYALWAARGYQHGSPEDDWFRAETQLKTTAAAAR